MNFTIEYFRLNKGRNKFSLPSGAEVLCLVEGSAGYGCDFEMAVKVRHDRFSEDLHERTFEVVFAFETFEMPAHETYIYKDKIVDNAKGIAAFLFEVLGGEDCGVCGEE